MQFGIFTVSDVTTDPTTGHTPDDTERVRAILRIAQHADQAGLDVFATGEHIRITFFLDRMPRGLRWFTEVVIFLVTTALFSLILYYAAEFTWDQWYWGETSPGLGYPAWLYSVWLPVLTVAIILRIIGRAWARLRRGPKAYYPDGGPRDA